MIDIDKIQFYMVYLTEKKGYFTKKEILSKIIELDMPFENFTLNKLLRLGLISQINITIVKKSFGKYLVISTEIQKIQANQLFN